MEHIPNSANGAQAEACLAWLNAHAIPYRLQVHQAAFTMEDIRRQGLEKEGAICKNLFLRDSKKGTRHFLVVVCGDKPVDLKALGETVGQRLSFASAKRLHNLLGLSPGSVSLLGLIADHEHRVEVFLDDALTTRQSIGFHPCENDKMVFLSYESVRKILEILGNKVETVTL